MKQTGTYPYILLAVAWLAAMPLQVHAAQEHMFGPTGIYGTLGKDAITVTRIDTGSPANGILKAGDVIVGAGTTTFKDHVRRELADAIDIAETEAAGGKLTLHLRDGKKQDITLAVLGTYSDTAPYNCPKTEAILKRAEKHLGGNDRFHLNLLATMALHVKTGAGEPKDVEPLPEGDDPLSGPPRLLGNRLYCTWDWGYQLITACERYLLTKDETALPGIRNMALTLAKGQDAGGLYGHQLATPERNGRLPGYAQMNQPSLTCFLGMLLARKCGVKDPELIEAIEQTHAFYASFIGRGALNYGVHGPNTRTFNNNGTSATAAIAMAIYGDKEGAQFFSQLAAASYDGLETGHATPFFNKLWTPLGAAVAGPEVASRFFKKARWLYTLYRRWDGAFTDNGVTSGRIDPAGFVLTYALGRRNLVITGRDADTSLWLTGQAAADAVAMGSYDYAAMSVNELIALTSHPIPQVRRGAGWTVKHREDYKPDIAALLAGGTKWEKMRAMDAVGYPAPREQGLPYMDAIGAVLRDTSEDPWVRVGAAGVLAYMGEPARKYYFDIVRMIVEERPEDRFGDIDWALGADLAELCKDPFAAGLVEDKDVFYKAARKLAQNKRQHVRADGMRMLAGMPLEDFHRVGDMVMHVAVDKDPTYHSYHNGGPVTDALTVLAHLNIAEGLPLAMAIEKKPDGKGSFKMRATWSVLAAYGANATNALAELQERYKGRTNFGRHTRAYNAMVKAIEADNADRSKLIRFEEAMQAGTSR